MIRVLHVSDTHLGYHQYHSPTRRDDFSRAFSQTIQEAIDRGVDAYLHTGDLYHSKNPNLQTQMDVTRGVKRLADHGIPFLTIVGNHERKRHDQFVDHLKMSLDNVVRLDSEGSWEKDNVVIHGFDHIPSISWDSTDLSLPENSCEYEMVAMHQLMDPPVPELFEPHDTREVLERFDGDVDILALGDYHERVAKEIAGTRVYYPGSTEMVAKDEPQNKYVSLLEFGDNITIEDVPIDSREFLDLTVTFNENKSALEQIDAVLDQQDVTGTVVHLSLMGADLPVSRSKAKSVIEDRDVVVARVTDERVTDYESDAVDYDTTDIETAIDEEMDGRDLSEAARDIDGIVRDLETKKSHVRDEARERMEEI